MISVKGASEYSVLEAALLSNYDFFNPKTLLKLANFLGETDIETLK